MNEHALLPGPPALSRPRSFVHQAVRWGEHLLLLILALFAVLYLVEY